MDVTWQPLFEGTGTRLAKFRAVAAWPEVINGQSLQSAFLNNGLLCKNLKAPLLLVFSQEIARWERRAPTLKSPWPTHTKNCLMDFPSSSRWGTIHSKASSNPESHSHCSINLTVFSFIGSMLDAENCSPEVFSLMPSWSTSVPAFYWKTPETQVFLLLCRIPETWNYHESYFISWIVL